MTAVDVDALDAARAAATPGPWRQDSAWPCDFGPAGDEQHGNVDLPENAALIVAAVNALPDLLAEVRRGRALRERLEELAESLTVATRDVGELSPEYRKHCGWHADLLRAALATGDPS